MHNRGINGKTRAGVLVNVGREDQLGLAALGWLVASINRYLGERGELGPSIAAVTAGSEVGPLEVESACPFGVIWLFDQLWQQLGAAARSASWPGWAARCTPGGRSCARTSRIRR